MSGNKNMSALKKAALLVGPLRRKYEEIEALRNEIDTLRCDKDALITQLEAQRLDIDLMQKAVIRSKLAHTKDLSEAGSAMPPVWIGRFSNKNEYDNDAAFHAFTALAAEIDEEVVKSHRPYQIKAFCPVCKCVTSMQLCFNTGHIDHKGVNNAWSEDVICTVCGLNSRQRALIDFLECFVLPKSLSENIYISEATTQTYKYLKRDFSDVTGSEFFGDDAQSGRLYDFDGERIRHEDLTALSFEDDFFDVVISQHVFEHVPDYAKAFKECCRVLKNGGFLIFSVPFFISEENTLVIAGIDDSGRVQHFDHPPEFHGNPVDNKGSLCFQHFGWDLLDCVRSSGFTDVFANFYWGRHKGFIGGRSNNMVFSAKKCN